MPAAAQGFTRRDVVTGAIGIGLTGWKSTRAPAAPLPDTAVDFIVPKATCDCHTHVFGDRARFPLSRTRTYTPPLALPGQLARLHRRLGVERVVVVTASAYGTDNSATLDAIATLGPGARGIIVVDEQSTPAQLDDFGRSGVKGVRLYLATPGQDPGEARRRLELALRQVEGRGWHIQIFANPSLIDALRDLVLSAAVPVVFDHFGGARGALGISQPGFGTLTELVHSGHAYVKLSAMYRLSNDAPSYSDMRPLARVLIQSNPDRILWGTDWPHTNGELRGKRPTDTFPFIPVDDPHLFNLFAAWVGSPELLQRILVSNPARLYEF